MMLEQEEPVKYFKLLNNAWRNLLDDFRDGVCNLPYEVEGPIRGYLFAECIRLMRHRHFKRPYQIWEEESYGRLFPDITLGSLGKKAEKRVIAVEIKYVGTTNKQTKQKVEQDLRKLEAYLPDAVESCFVMIDTSQRYTKILDLELLGIRKKCWKWRTINRQEGKSFDALIAWKGGFMRY